MNEKIISRAGEIVEQNTGKELIVHWCLLI
jgi:hypothetical protein